MPDFVIIGGGVYGCGVAWELAQRGAEVCLLEAGHVADGASGGLGRRGVRANGRDLRELPLMALAYELWPDLAATLEGPTGYERLGGLTLFEHELDRRHAETQAWMQNRQDIPSVMLDRAALREREPLVSEAVIGALFCPKDGVADHTATTQAYAAAAARLGADIREKTPVASLEIVAGRVTGVITSQGEVIQVKKAALLATNHHSKAFVAQQFGYTLPVWSLLPQVAITAPLERPLLKHLIGHASRKLAMKMDAGQRVMISGGWHGQRHPETGLGETLPAQVAGNLAEAVATFPTLAGIAVERAAADRPELIAVDDIPIIDFLPGGENLLLATGWSGHGWAIAPAVCQLLTNWLLSGQRPQRLAPFTLSRFG